MRATRPHRMIDRIGTLVVLIFLVTGLSCSGMGGLGRGEEVAATTDQLLQRANSAYQQGDLAEARQFYAQILDQEPEHVEALFRLGVLDYRQGRWETSRTQFLKVLSISPNHVKATYNLGVIYAAEGALKDTEKAAFFFDKYLSLAPNAPQKKQIVRWKALQASGKRGEGSPPIVKSGGGIRDPETTEASSDDLKQWLQQEAERLEP